MSIPTTNVPLSNDVRVVGAGSLSGVSAGGTVAATVTGGGAGAVTVAVIDPVEGAAPPQPTRRTDPRKAASARRITPVRSLIVVILLLDRWEAGGAPAGRGRPARRRSAL